MPCDTLRWAAANPFSHDFQRWTVVVCACHEVRVQQEGGVAVEYLVDLNVPQQQGEEANPSAQSVH